MLDFKQEFMNRYDKALQENSFLLPSDLSGTFSLEPDHEDDWWDKITDQSRIVNDIGIHQTDGDTVYENELTLGTNGEDIYRPGVGGVDSGDSVNIGDSQRSFKPEEFRAIIPWTLDLSESIKDGEAAYNKFLDMVSRAEANSLERAILHGVQAGANNSQRGSVTGCFDGILEQIRSLGHVVDATDSGYDDRLADIEGESNDKFLDLFDALPSKYDDGRNILFMDPGIRRQIAARLERMGFAVADKFLKEGVYGSFGVHGVPTYPVPLLRTNFMVQGTGTLAGGQSQVNGNGVAKARATTITVDDTTGFTNTNTGIIGALTTGKAYGINAERFTVSGSPSGTVITAAAALGYDHDDNEYVSEYSSAPTEDGRYCFLTKLENMRIVSRRGLTVKIFEEPRKSAWSVVISRKLTMAVLNPDAAALLRDLKAA